MVLYLDHLCGIAGLGYTYILEMDSLFHQQNGTLVVLYCLSYATSYSEYVIKDIQENHTEGIREIYGP